MPNTLLEELRMEASQLLHDMEATEDRQDRLSRAIQEVIAPSLRRIYDYLNQFRQHIKLLDPEIMVDLPIRGVGSCAGLRQKNYRLRSGEEDSLNSVVFAFDLYRSNPCRISFKYPGDATTLLTSLKAEGLRFAKTTISAQNTPNQSILLEVVGEIPVRLEFKANPNGQTIDVIVHNFNEVGKAKHTLQADSINDEMLDQLGRFILRRENTFLINDVSWGYRQRLRAKLETDAEAKQRSLADTAEIFVGKIRTLFQKKNYLIKLNYRGLELKMDKRDLPCRLGRKSPSEIKVNTPHVSREHATLAYEGSKLIIRDHSSNGTFVRPAGEEEFKLKDNYYQLAGRGLISLGEPVSDDNPDLVYYSVLD
jgi:hypothetical protein